MTIILLIVGLCMLAVAGFTTDMTNLYLHKQLAQNAANAACTAAAMDMMTNMGSNIFGGFTEGVNFSCSPASTSTPCKYAALNGYPGGGLAFNQPSNDVAVSFPSGASCPNAGCPAPGVTPAPASLVPYPFVRIDIIDRTLTNFSGLITSRRTADVRAYAVCGLGWTKSPIPIVVLSPSGSATLSQGGTSAISVVGGPVRSIQVNSSSPTAAVVSSIDLTHGGPSFNGSDMGIFGGPSTAPSGFVTAGQGAWRYPSTPFNDPFALAPAPAQPGLPQVPADLAGSCTAIPCNIAYHDAVHSCPDTSGCKLYTAGYYANGIVVKDATAVFDPGLYYVRNGLGLMSNSLVRPGTGVGDGTGGTVFYLTGDTQKCSGQTGSVCVGSNSGRSGDAFDTTLFKCPGAPDPDPRIGLPATLSGNVMMAPCSGTYGDPGGKVRGILFYQDRASSNGGGWGGGGGFLLAGSIYFHQCNSSGTGAGCSAPPTGYNANFTFQGNSGSQSFVIGNIITDKLAMGGSPTITMVLDANASLSVVKASLFF